MRLLAAIALSASIAAASDWTDYAKTLPADAIAAAQVANARPALSVAAVTTTNIVQRDAALVDAEAKYITLCKALRLDWTKDDMTAALDQLKAAAASLSAEERFGLLQAGVELLTLRAAVIERGGDPAAATGEPTVAEVRTAQIVTYGESQALRLLGREATPADIEESRK